MHDCSRPIVYDGRSFLDASLRGTLREHRSKGEDTVLSLPLLTRFNDSIRESHHDDFLSSLSLYIYIPSSRMLRYLVECSSTPVQTCRTAFGERTIFILSRRRIQNLFSAELEKLEVKEEIKEGETGRDKGRVEQRCYLLPRENCARIT